MKLNYRTGINMAVAKSGLTNKQFRKQLGINTNMTWYNRKKKPTLTLQQAVEIADVAGITIYQLIDYMRDSETVQS